MTSRKHILIIDDDPFIRRLFGAKLASAGFEMLYASEGHVGREMARRFMPDLVILDINMPETDGYEIARLLRNETKTKNIPVVFLTSEDFSAEAEKAVKEVYVVDYIHKGIDLDEFIKRIKKAISAKNINSKGRQEKKVSDGK